MHAKYEVSISYGSKVMAKVKVFAAESQTDRVIDRTTIRYPRIPFWGHNKEIPLYLLSLKWGLQFDLPIECLLLQMRKFAVKFVEFLLDIVAGEVFRLHHPLGSCSDGINHRLMGDYLRFQSLEIKVGEMHICSLYIKLNSWKSCLIHLYSV